MSVNLPVCALVFGSVTPPQSDVLDLKVHLGATKEVSSFNCLLKNFNKKYSPGGTYPITEDDNGTISIGRGVNCPLLATIRVEKIRAISIASQENYMRVLGRCWGEKIFRKVVTKTYENQKGEAVVKDVIDNYVGLSHVRNSTELIEDTDTTYALLEYEKTPAFDILKYIAATADKGGVIGFDSRVAPDGKYEFFPRNSKTCSVSLSERLERGEYSKSIFRKRDKIFVEGAAEKKYPSDESWTETLDIDSTPPNDWVSGTGTGSVSLDSVTKAVGSYSIKHTTNTADYYGTLRLVIPTGMQPNLATFPSSHFLIARESDFSSMADIRLFDNTAKEAIRWITIPEADEWLLMKLNAGPKYENEWNAVDAGFNWEIINEIWFEVHFPGTGTGSFWVDNLFFNHARWSATYGSGERELPETDEELHSDAECLRRAKALFNYFSGTAEHIKLISDVIDYGTTPILPADRIWVTLPNENVNGYYRVIYPEYHLRARDQTLEMTLELGKEPMLLADYLYALKIKTAKVARYKIGRI